MNDDNNIEDELADSIARIVNEETTGAEVFVKNTAKQSYSTMREESEELDEDEEDDESDIEDDEKDKKNHKKIIIIVSIAVVVVAVVTAILFFVLNRAYNSTRDNYAYYNTQGYEAYDNKEYAQACEYFEKALTFNEGKTNTNMMLYLYEAYSAIGEDDKAEEVLLNVIGFDDDNYYNAMYLLVQMYEEAEDYDKIADLYEDNKDAGDDVKNLFTRYVPSNPGSSPAGDTYSSDQEIALLAQGSNITIYYTTNGTEPTLASLKYTGKIKISSGTTVIKFFAVNEYGIASDIVEEEYVVNYSAPTIPVISPSTTSFSQNDPVLVTISNFSTGSTVYYTLDGTEANQNSTEYTEPFELPAGSTIVNVLVVNEYGLTTRTSRTYNVVYTDAYTQGECLDLIEKALVDSEIVTDNDGVFEDADGNVCTLSYYTKRTIDDSTVYMYYFSVSGTMQDYWYGADANSGIVYRITGSGGEYKLTEI